jgi:hypothetical protein
MGKEQAAAVSALARYETGRFNVLYPVVSLNADGVSPALVESVSVLTISPAPAAAETYHDFRYANERDGKFALTALALAKIAAAAGVKWVPELCKVLERTRRPDGHVYIRYQAGAGVRQPNGEWHIEIASRDIDTEDAAEQLRNADEEAVKKGRKKFTPEEIDARVRQQMLQLREHALSHAETKAKNRVIRRILSLKQVYTIRELGMPFVVPRLVYRPDLADPMALERVQIEGSRAAAGLYGDAGTGMSPPSPALPDGDAPDPTPPSETTSEGQARQAPVAYGEGAIGPEEPPNGSAEPTAGVTSEGPPAVGEPKTDPVFEDGPYRGRHWSDIAESNPDFMRGLLASTRAKAKRELLEAWLRWFFPELDEPEEG